MVTPVIGPVVRTIDRGRTYYARIERYTQARPYNLALPYKFFNSRMVRCDTSATAGNYMDYGLTSVPAVNDAKTVAYDRFKNAISSRASWGANLAEIGQSYSMIANRALQLSSFTRSVRRLDFSGAAKALRMSVPKGVSRHKSIANNWLEFSFGWKPLVGDVYSSLNILQQPFKDIRVRQKGNSTRVYSPTKIRPPYSKVFDGSSDIATVTYGGDVKVNNPNLWLMNQMGLVNPLTVLWEIVPFSFVVDWFVNVEQVLGSFTDFYGLSLTDTYTTVFVRSNVLFSWTNYGWIEKFDRIGLVRSTGIAGPVLQIRPYKAPSLTRAANAVSVLTQLLRK